MGDTYRQSETIAPSPAMHELFIVGPQGGASVRLLPVEGVPNPGKMATMGCVVGGLNTGTLEAVLPALA